ncbi:M48 family metalloprotease [Lentibacter algarum]|uniref:M48 family metalloprotease n=1 Tax=Lentibacter algarum TaxID=576131 RepID=UPI001C0A5147|nr:M48 family metalloprotease [Lentibacter algarum]MBU2983567.1 M48 family metalloprotease [Lentibacter algarum]
MTRILCGLTGISLLFLGACVESTVPQEPVSKPAVSAALPERTAAKLFVRVVDVVEPVAERECRARTKGMNCDYKIVVDDRPGQPVNAAQTLDKDGRPIIIFTLAMIKDVRNADELAFVMGHEAAHHIAGHLERQQRNASTGALVFAGLAALAGADAQTLQNATDIGAQVGARTYSKDYELEADILGTVISKKAGYDPVKGAAFFSRIPDPGDRFLGTHPPNAQRIEVVRKTAAAL